MPQKSVGGGDSSSKQAHEDFSHEQLTCLGSEFKKFLHPLDIEKATAWVKSLKNKQETI